MKVRIHGVEHDLDPGKLTFDEGVAIEDVTGETFSEWTASLGRGSMKSLRAYALVLLQRSDSQARLADVGRMPMSDLEFVVDPAEKPVEASALQDLVEDPTRPV